MAITLDVTRPKAIAQSAIALSLATGTITENDTLDSFFIPINATGLTIPDFSVADVATTNGSDILTTTGGGFEEVRVGDAIAAGTNIGAGTVIAKTDNNTIQVSVSATADGTEALTFSPAGGGAVNITLVGIEISLVQNADGKITAVFTGHTYDGSLQGTEGTEANSTAKVNLNQFNLDLDSILNTARIPRTN
ncbi:MAG: hypothetical protein QNJ72_15000 [Pleurocapsa sp. MO_226.B13]|nr:hypothetical protein [Pleurocapsa sp. MO_226.B13]